MNSDEFREFGKAAIDFVADYLDNIREREVLPSVTPGYLQELLPNTAPEKSEDWKTIMTDLNKIIMPGITHWQSPNFHAYYPTQTSFPSIIGDMLTAGLGVVGFSWICSPACTELETVVMDWLAKMLGLPDFYLHSDDGKGGGIIQGSASEAILVAVLAAREQAVKRYSILYPEMSEQEIRGKLVAYSSDQSNSAIEKASLLASVPVRLLEADTNCSLTGETFQRAVEEDLTAGKFPIICIATLGTTGTCSYDKVEEIGPICEKHNIWLHVDAAYAGGALVCPEYRHLLNGIEYVESFNFNMHKWMLTNFDCTAMWLRNADLVVDSFNVDRIYLKHKYQGTTKIPDFRHWQLALGRKFRALKVWIVLRSHGIEKIQTMIRTHIDLARKFATFVENDDNFEIAIKPSMGLVVFRHKGDNEFTKELLEKITEKKQIYMIPATIKTKYVIRFVVAGLAPLESDIDFAWNCIKSEAELLRCSKGITGKTINGEIKKINDRFASDLSISMENEKVQ